MVNEFTWVDTYKELAKVLLRYENRQKELIALIKEMRDNGLLTISLNDQNPEGTEVELDEIDPFTFYANFNRGIKEENRIQILEYIIKKFALTLAAPSDFVGIPILDNRKAWFFGYKFRRESDSVSSLWKLFKEALSPSGITKDTFNKVIKQWGVFKNITCGLFWIDPDRYISIDGRNEQYLGFKIAKDTFDFDSYMKIIEAAKSRNKPFTVLSKEAWLSSIPKGHPEGSDKLCLIATAGDTEALKTIVQDGVKFRSGWASWWSFVIRDDHAKKLSKPFYLYINAGGGRFPYRLLVSDYQTSRGNEGIASPWPEITDDEYRGKTKIGDKLSTIFKTWFKVTAIDELEPVLTLDHFEFAEGFNRGNILNQNSFGYAYLKDPANVKIIDGGSALEPTQDNINQPYSLLQCAAETGLSKEDITSWVKAIHRKGQAIIYGPPGTGKTYVAERLARFIASEGDGIVETVQFHPSYSYEDFIEGIRPKTDKGAVTYPLVAGRFLDFCQRASKRKGTNVLIVDEINRANLSKVFGELMYLLEYREKSIKLAGGTNFFIPKNVRLVGTMNTADRSIALVDHALRRRFAFLSLRPNYDILQKYHQDNDFSTTGLIKVLQNLNNQIHDPHYEVGITFFLRHDLNDHLKDIWAMEIEPYIEEYFFDQLEKVNQFRWDSVKGQIIS